MKNAKLYTIVHKIAHFKGYFLSETIFQKKYDIMQPLNNS